MQNLQQCSGTYQSVWKSHRLGRLLHEASSPHQSQGTITLRNEEIALLDEVGESIVHAPVTTFALSQIDPPVLQASQTKDREPILACWE